jgi:SAM-dependent MidA family methyltransferase
VTDAGGDGVGHHRRVSFAEFMESALYDPATGFYAGSGRAGRRADFLTSPEVGPLFGAILARWLDDTWRGLGRPDPFVVVEWGAGPGTLARTVRVAEPECAWCMRYLMVERSGAQRALHAEHLDSWCGDLDPEGVEEFVRTAGDGPRFASAGAGPERFVGAVVANELLDNLPFEIVRHDAAGNLERLDVVTGDAGDDFSVTPADVPADVRALLLAAPAGEWMPWQPAARTWVSESLAALVAGSVLVVDYGASTAELASRPAMGWLRTYSDQERGGHPLDDPGSRDITADVAIDQIQLDRPATIVTNQRDFLLGLHIEALVEEGRRVWNERAHAADLVAIRARSRVREAEALTESGGLGDFVVLEWHVPASAPY